MTESFPSEQAIECLVERLDDEASNGPIDEDVLHKHLAACSLKLVEKSSGVQDIKSFSIGD